MSERKKYDIIITDRGSAQVAKLRENLEDLELYLIEIESTLDMLDSNPDEETKIRCQLRLAGIQQRIAEIGQIVRLSPKANHRTFN